MVEVETRVAMYLRRFGKSTGQMHSVHPKSAGDTMQRLELGYMEGDGSPAHEMTLEAVMQDGRPVIRATFKNAD